MARVVLDSSIVLALFDPDDVHHASAVAEITQRRSAGDRFVLPALVLAEVLVGAARRAADEVTQRRQQVVAAFGPVRVIDADVAERAARLRAAHPSLRMPDAVTLAVAAVDGATALTCDTVWPRYYDRAVVLG
ncbi:MAG: PIN domain-containing protein [Actinomycetota bacterium]|nr:PIN domain-containing protein [Actinomycetota bacterium]